MKNHSILTLTLLTLGLILIGGFLLNGRIAYEQFDSDVWKNWIETEEAMSLRWDMMNSLRNNHELIGKSKSEIVELLGEPESKTESKFWYYLGYSKRGINTGRLIIKFDHENKVKGYSIWDG